MAIGSSGGRDPSPAAPRDWMVLGQGMTVGQVLPLDTADVTVAARAIRRALADARRRAVEVDVLVVGSSDPIAPDCLARLARRALGPHDAGVRAEGLKAEPAPAQDLAQAAADHLAASAAPGDGLAIAVGLGDDSTTVAICLGAVVYAPRHDPV